MEEARYIMRRRERAANLAGYDRLVTDLLGHVFARLLWIVVIHLLRAGMLFRAFVPAATAPIGSWGHAHHHHQSLAIGIGADALAELCWLPD
jgi:hypothetical protein